MSFPKQIVAFDIGARSVRALWMQLRGNTPVVTRAESFALPLDAENPHKLISTWVAKLGLSRHFCAISLPGSQTIFQSGRIPTNDPRSPEQVASMEIAQFNEMAGDAMLHDVVGFETPFEPGVRRYLMSMARPAAINKANQETALCNIRPADLISAPVALYNSMVALADKQDAPTCFINIGHLSSEIAIGTADGLLFARSIPAGGKIFSDAVMQSAGLSAVQAETRKHAECGLETGHNCQEALQQAADRWLAQLNSAMGVYRSQFPDRKMAISRVIITGGGAKLKGLCSYLEGKLDLPVTTSEAHTTNVPADYRPYLGTYDLAYGLALTALGKGKAYLSLLPGDLKDEAVFRAKKGWWIAAAILMFATMAIYSAAGVFLLKRDHDQLDAERDQLRRREQIDKRIQDLRTMAQQMQTNALPLNHLLLNGPLAREVLSLVAMTVDPNDWITLFCDEKTYTPGEQNPDEEGTVPKPVATSLATLRTLRNVAPPPKSQVATRNGKSTKELADQLDSIFVVEGYTPDPSLKSVQDMIMRLKTSPEVVRVDLRSDDQVLAPTGLPELEEEKLPSFRRFVIEIEVQRL